MHKSLLVLLAVMVLAACATTSAPQEPRVLEISGPYTQPGTGVSFPERVAGFRRTSVVAYNQAATNVGVGYHHMSVPVVLHLYVYPAPKVMSLGSPQHVVDLAKQKVFQRAFEDTKYQVMAINPDAETVSEGPHQLTQGEQAYSGMHAEFKYDTNVGGQVRTVSSHLYLFQVDDTLFKYRVTTPEQVNAEDEIQEFLNRFKLEVNAL